ncbi:MAG: DUF5012 domain-containing protein, partial [Bacteroidales bacterium]|nr:DUF5012 domain-containing protein [Bacteroidales bacterium]
MWICLCCYRLFFANADNTITHVSSYNQGWGDSLNDLVDGIYDPTTKSITWDAFYVLPNNFKFQSSSCKRRGINNLKLTIMKNIFKLK